jgi:hypothetical protein
MKLLIAFALASSLIFTTGIFASDKEDMKKQIAEMQKKIDELKRQQNSISSSGGLKVKDYEDSSMGQSNTSSSPSSNQQISPEDMKKLQDAMKKGKKYLEERNKYLEELENEE